MSEIREQAQAHPIEKSGSGRHGPWCPPLDPCQSGVWRSLQGVTRALLVGKYIGHIRYEPWGKIRRNDDNISKTTRPSKNPTSITKNNLHERLSILEQHHTANTFNWQICLIVVPDQKDFIMMEIERSYERRDQKIGDSCQNSRTKIP